MGIYERLGVKTYINASSNGTALGGSIMRPEVLAAMEEASRSYVQIPVLLEKAGQRIAELAGVEAAYITSGAAGGVALAVAACMTGQDWAKVHQLPNSAGMKNDVIIQVMQRNFYELMIRLAGARLIEVGLANRTYPWHLESAINEQTVAIVHFCAYSPPSDLPIAEVIQIAHRRGVPVIVDAASEFIPFSMLRYYADLGADLTIFSGGKQVRGPQSSGLILGRQDLIAACAMNASPNHGVARPMKVGKEEIVGLLTALELWADPEFERAELAACESRTAYLVETLSKIDGVRAYRGSARTSLPADTVPVTRVEWDQGIIPMTRDQVIETLRRGTPGIFVGQSQHGLMLGSHTLQPGEERVVAERVMEVLSRQYARV